MSLPKVFTFTTIFLLCAIGFVAIFKDKKKANKEIKLAPIEINLDQPLVVSNPPSKPSETVQSISSVNSPLVIDESEQAADRIQELFNSEGSKLPIVETITYKSKVDWQKDRAAWLSDYAKHYQTSRHFIARSLNKKPDYFKQDIAEGDRFNVLRKDKNIQFYLHVDLASCKMRFYYELPDQKERVLLKTYQVGLGRSDPNKTSGYLTPTGKYTLGNKIAIYKPKMMGYYNGEQIEMINVFGTRWIPFDKEIGECSAAAKGLGIHGLPWQVNAAGELLQDKNSIGKYCSDGCIRLTSEDIEELFAIIITKPTTIELVNSINRR